MRAPRGERSSDLQERVIRHELTQHLLLVAEQLALGELLALQDGLVDLARVAAVRAAEQGELAGRLRLAAVEVLAPAGERDQRDLVAEERYGLPDEVPPKVLLMHAEFGLQY